jgi:hypothetical protein
MNRDDLFSGEGGDSNSNRFHQQPPHREVDAIIIDERRQRGGEETRDESTAPSPPPAHMPSSRDPQLELRVLPSDVLCGRGKASFNHGAFNNSGRLSYPCIASVCDSLRRPSEDSSRLSALLLLCPSAGNRRFRDSIASWLPRYRDAVHLFDKALIVDAVVEDVRRSGGRFLRYDHSASRAVSELSEHQVKEKVGRALRDAVASGEATKRTAKRRRSSNSAETTKKGSVSTPKEAGPPPRLEGPGRRVALWSASGTRPFGGSKPSAAAAAAPMPLAPSDDAHEQFLEAINTVLGPAHADEAGLHRTRGRKDSTDDSDPFHHF